MLKINGKPVPATHFLYDGCHKVYLIVTPADRERIMSNGWTDEDLRPASELPDVWATTCFLRFINSGDLKTTYVHQGRDAVVTWEGK